MGKASEGERSDRGRHVTEQVTLWLVNDGDLIEDARRMAFCDGDALRLWAQHKIRRARPHSAAWQVGQELAANDYGRVNWREVVAELVGMGE